MAKGVEIEVEIRAETDRAARTPSIATIVRRLHAAELDTLREIVERQHAEIERLRADLAFAEQAAESWRDDALRMMEDACADGSRSPGITMSGALVALSGWPPERSA
jgi:hypothetical protein